MQPRQILDVVDQLNYSELFWYAAHTGNIERLKFLFVNNPVAIDYILHDVTPLWTAANFGHDQVVEELIKSGAKVNFKHPTGQSVLWTAAGKGHTKIVKLLLENGANSNELSNKCSPLFIAAQNNHIDTVKELINHTCDLNLPYQINGRTPLFSAVFNGHDEIVDELIKANASIGYTDYEGFTALHAACSQGRSQIVILLVESGADVNAENLFGRTPLSYAGKWHHVATYLLAQGALPDLRQAAINQKFEKYLDFYPILHPYGYPSYKIQVIKAGLQIGLCHGYSKIHRFMNDAGLKDKLKQQLDLTSNWDDSIETLKRNKDLEIAINSLLFNVYRFHESDPLRCEQNIIIHAQDADLNFLSDSYEEVFRIGFVFKYDELESLFKLILKEGLTIDLNVLMEKRSFHSISVTMCSQNEYELVDSNTSIIKAIKASTLADIINLLKIILRSNENCIGLAIRINMHSPCNEIKREYLQIKNDFCELLISSRSLNKEIDLKDVNNLTSLFYAIYDVDIEMAKKLISCKATPCTENEFIPPIYLAVQTNSHEIVARLLENGADVNSKWKEDSLLICAAGLGLIEMVKLLLKEKATVDCIGNGGGTPLYMACQNGFYQIAKALITEKANVNFSRNSGYTPLLVAISNGHSSLVELLIHNGADIDDKAISTTSIGLRLAINNGFLDIVKILVNAGANLLNLDGDTSAVEFAKQKGQDSIVNYLTSLNNQIINLDSRQSNPCERIRNPITFFKASTKEGKQLIKARHASPEAQRAYDDNYGLSLVSRVL